jgi:hypothetical protein
MASERVYSIRQREKAEENTKETVSEACQAFAGLSASHTLLGGQIAAVRALADLSRLPLVGHLTNLPPRFFAMPCAFTGHQSHIFTPTLRTCRKSIYE